MTDSTNEITNLLCRYAELMDSGKLEDAAALFRHAGINVPDAEDLLDETRLLALWQKHVIIYPCGTPRTKHVISNPLIEVDETAGKATARSYYTVYQQTAALPLQVIACGRYHDQFECLDGVWVFTYRDYSLLDLVGDMSAHLRSIAIE